MSPPLHAFHDALILSENLLPCSGPLGTHISEFGIARRVVEVVDLERVDRLRGAHRGDDAGPEMVALKAEKEVGVERWIFR